jgi:hypothetical protein
MTKCAATPIEPADFHLASNEFFLINEHIRKTSLATNADRGGMFTDEYDSMSVLPLSDLVQQPRLKSHGGLKIDFPQQKDFQRRGFAIDVLPVC